MIRLMCCASLLLIIGHADVMAEDELPPLRVRNDPILVLSNGENVIGELVEMDGSTVVFRRAGEERTVRYQRDQYLELREPITADYIIRERGRILLADEKDRSLEVGRTLRWGIEQGATAACLEVAVAAVERYPKDQSLAEYAVEMVQSDAGEANQELLSDDQLDMLEFIARRGLESNDRWEEGHRVLSHVLRQREQLDEYHQALEAWIQRFPTSLEANVEYAELARERGDIEQARESYRKAFSLHQHQPSGTAFAQLSLVAGELAEATEAAQELRDAGVDVEANTAVVGIVHVHSGDNSTGLELLEQSLVNHDALDQDLAALATYHLGLAVYRLGNVDRAVSEWRRLDGPAARFALAVAEHQLVSEADAAALQETMGGMVAEHNASIALEQRDHETALAALQDVVGERPLFLKHIAGMLAEGASEGSLSTLESHSLVDSLRWQIYGHILAQRYDQAIEVIGRLPENDYYGYLCRIFIAEARGQREMATAIFKSMPTELTKYLPEYQAKLADLFDAADDLIRSYDFDWPEGFELAHGWRSRSKGTGVSVQIQGGRLVLSGRQSAAPDPVTRAWCLVAPERLYQAGIQLDLRDIGAGIAGLELLDEEQKNGIAYGVGADGILKWRQQSDGVWGEWQSLGHAIDGGTVTLNVRYERRLLRVSAMIGDERIALGKDLKLTTDYLCFGAFGMAAPGEDWTLAVESARIQVESEASGSSFAPSGASRRGGR